ncbi:MAG: mechanosensitive ion channel family protein [Prochloraceae cyanobacterium]
MEKFIELAIEFGTTLGIRILTALLILLIGLQIAKWVRSIVKKVMSKSQIDVTISTFVSNLSYIGFISFVVIAALTRLGVATASFVAVIGAAGLAIGLALQGSLSNLASGVLIILFRPFKIGDFIAAGGVLGSVQEISFFTTTLNTPDNSRVIVPNSKIYGDTITNYSANDTRRVEIVAGIGYEDDIDKAKSVLQDIVRQDERILAEPEPTYQVTELGDSSVNFTVRVWVERTNFWAVYCDLTEQVKKRFDAAGISIPYPQQDIYLHSVENKQ